MGSMHYHVSTQGYHPTVCNREHHDTRPYRYGLASQLRLPPYLYWQPITESLQLVSCKQQWCTDVGHAQADTLRVHARRIINPSATCVQLLLDIHD